MLCSNHQYFSIPLAAFEQGDLSCDLLASIRNTPSWHTNYLELFAGLTAVRRWGSSLQVCTVACFTDSSPVHSWLTKKWGTKNVIPLLKRLHLMQVRFDIQLQSQLVGSKGNEMCDALSRGSMERYAEALDTWKTRGGSKDAYTCPPELVDDVPNTPLPDE